MWFPSSKRVLLMMIAVVGIGIFASPRDEGIAWTPVAEFHRDSEFSDGFAARMPAIELTASFVLAPVTAPAVGVGTCVEDDCLDGECILDGEGDCLACLACGAVAALCAGMGLLPCLASIPAHMWPGLILACGSVCYGCFTGGGGPE